MRQEDGGNGGRDAVKTLGKPAAETPPTVCFARVAAVKNMGRQISDDYWVVNVENMDAAATGLLPGDYWAAMG